jgi:hypothetical protein
VRGNRNTCIFILEHPGHPITNVAGGIKIVGNNNAIRFSTTVYPPPVGLPPLPPPALPPRGPGGRPAPDSGDDHDDDDDDDDDDGHGGHGGLRLRLEDTHAYTPEGTDRVMYMDYEVVAMRGMSDMVVPMSGMSDMAAFPDNDAVNDSEWAGIADHEGAESERPPKRRRRNGKQAPAACK